jgi:hypothetical protein
MFKHKICSKFKFLKKERKNKRMENKKQKNICKEPAKKTKDKTKTSTPKNQNHKN